MYTLFIVLIVIVSVLLILLVLVQNSKGGGLAAGFTSSNQIMGVRKTTDFLEKATWTLVAALVVFSVVAVGFNKSSDTQEGSEISTQVENAAQEAPGVVAPGFGENPQQTEQAPAQEQPKN